MPLSEGAGASGVSTLSNNAPFIYSRSAIPVSSTAVNLAAIGQAAAYNPNDGMICVSTNQANVFFMFANAYDQVVRTVNNAGTGQASDACFADFYNGSGFLVLAGTTTVYRIDSGDPLTAAFIDAGNGGTFNASGFGAFSTVDGWLGRIAATNPNCSLSVDGGANWNNDVFTIPGGAQQMQYARVSRDGSLVAIAGNNGFTIADDITTLAGVGAVSPEGVTTGDFDDTNYAFVMAYGAGSFVGRVDYVTSDDFSNLQTVPAANNCLTQNNVSGTNISTITYVPALSGWVFMCGLYVVGFMSLESMIAGAPEIVPGLVERNSPLTLTAPRAAVAGSDGNLAIMTSAVTIATNLVMK